MLPQCTLSPGDFPSVLSLRSIGEGNPQALFMGWHHIGRLYPNGTYVATDSVPLGKQQRGWILEQSIRLASDCVLESSV